MHIGMVVGTHGSVPHIHLHLETRKRMYPNVPMVVHDDDSPVGPRLHELCDQYGATFVSSRAPQHTPLKTDYIGDHYLGDLATYITGLRLLKDCDYVVKFSRRLIPKYDFTSDLLALACRDINNPCGTYGLTVGVEGIRTEAVAMNRSMWISSHALIRMEETLLERNVKGLFELYWYDVAQQAGPIGQWASMLAGSRFCQSSRCLWHSANTVEEYSHRAVSFHLPYTPDHFKNPDSH